MVVLLLDRSGNFVAIVHDVRLLLFLQELVSALHGLVLLYEKQFQIAALRNTDSEGMGVGNVSTSITATGWIHVSIETSELIEKESKLSMKNLNSHPAARSASTISQSPPESFAGSSGSSDDQFLDSLPRKNPVPGFAPSPLSSVSSISGKSFFTNVWKGMIFLASDPNPSVAHMAQHVVHGVHDKVTWLSARPHDIMHLLFLVYLL